MKQFPGNLKNPPKQYRAVPFWSWNDRLDPEFLRWQIREMDKAGLGGYFMHARGGLRTKYMGEDWMKCIDACIEEGNKLGMNSWCYDEEGWPSGFAGGKVPALGAEYQVKWLELEQITNGVCSVQMSDGTVQADSNTMQVNVGMKTDDGTMYTCNDTIQTDGAMQRDCSILGVYRMDAIGRIIRIGLDDIRDSGVKCVIRQKSSPYYFDILNKDAVKAFIDFTHEEYYQQFKEHFGKGMPGFFTDEPQYSVAGIPWSHVIPEVFLSRYGYDILDVLPALFVECQGYQKVRYDFWSVASELYTESFGKQIYEWCDEHNCKLTGHVMMEDTLHSQMVSTAGAMTFYEYMQIPGMDWLGRNISNPVIPRQVSSVANQLGKPFILSEMFALCGWDVSFEELKWIAEWQYVNGVNLMCQHLEGYTLEGSRKRDYPPSMFYQQSWWTEYKNFNDYFARLGMLLADGSSACDVLLLHPIKSGWIAYNHTNTPALRKLDKDFAHATETLMGLHIDHHYGDETIIGKYGKVKSNKFIVGQCEYSVVVMPSMLTIDDYTLQLLYEFSDNGGIVISIGDFPQLVSGKKNSSLEALKNKVVCISEDERKLYPLLMEAGIILLSIEQSEAQGSSQNIREITAIHSRVIDYEGSRAYFMVNHSQKETYKAIVKIKTGSSISKLNIENGEVEKINSRPINGIIAVELEFLPMQSFVLVSGEAAGSGRSPDKNDLSPDTDIDTPHVDKSGISSSDGIDTSPIDEIPNDLKRDVSSTIKRDVKIITPGKSWDIEAADLNSLTLDYCCYSINHGEWQKPVPVISLMNILLNLQRSCDVTMKFIFEADLDLDRNREFILAVEAADKLRITVNGNEVVYTDIGWWKDSAFKKIDIKPFVKMGSNEIILERRFCQSQKVYDVLFGESVLETEKNKLTYDTELESIYVVGDFGVVSKSGYTNGERKALFTEGPFVIVDQPVKTVSGQLTQEGFCFFAGSLKLSQSLRFSGNTEENKEDEKYACTENNHSICENNDDNNKSKTRGNRILLDLGKPDAPVSKLFINDQPVKTLMWAPYTVDITEFVHEGDNKLTLQLFAGNRNLLGPHHHRNGELYFVAPYDFSGSPVNENNRDKDTWRDRYCFVRFGV